MFNISWFLVVYTHSAVWAPVIAGIHLLWHFQTIGRGLVEVKFVLAVTLLGVFLDQTLFAIGVFNSANSLTFAPLWISCLWPPLATTFMHAFSTLQHRPVLASIAGAIGGGASYIAGTEMSDVAFASPLWGPIFMAALWAILFPSLLVAAKTILPEKVADNE